MEGAISCGAYLVIGGARSGKSSYAEKMALSIPPPRIYIATAKILDDEMKERIQLHRERRGSEWKTIEEPLNILSAIERIGTKANVVLIDCITMWLTNLLFDNALDEKSEVLKLCEFLDSRCKVPIILVSNEVGMGIVPENALARRFRDLAGWANQKLAEVSRTVTWVVAGIPVVIKSNQQSSF